MTKEQIFFAVMAMLCTAPICLIASLLNERWDRFLFKLGLCLILPMLLLIVVTFAFLAFGIKI